MSGALFQDFLDRVSHFVIGYLGQVLNPYKFNLYLEAIMSEARIEYACGAAGKVVVARILPGTDMIEGIEEACAQNGIKCAYVSCIGSVREAGYMYLIEKPEAKLGGGYGDMSTKGWSELITGTGFVGHRDGKYDSHFHATLVDTDGKVFAGHMVRGRNPVFATIDVIITEIQAVELSRRDDVEVGLPVFSPKKC
jgi:predicted DNA-binding protein with PD1-like motif